MNSLRELRARGRRRAALLLAVAAMAFAALLPALVSCRHEHAAGAAVTVPPLPPPPPPPALDLPATLFADQGFPLAAEARASSPVPGPLTVRIDYGEDAPVTLTVAAGDAIELAHTYRGSGAFAIHVAIEGPTGQASGATEVAVAARRVVFVQGMNSESRCPGGSRFLDRAPEWLAPYLEADPWLQTRLALESTQFDYFSYSGRYCDGSNGTTGAAPDYRGGDTCHGIASDAAPRLRAFIDALPGKVTVVAHSMGGLIAAYVAGSDPAWAEAHIASVVTFDSPLEGIDDLRGELFGLYSFASDGCGHGDPAMADLRDGSAVVRAAQQAPAAVPFYALDGSRDEGRIGIAEAVPGDRTWIPGVRWHGSVAEQHSGIWSDAPRAGATPDKRAVVACALALDGC